MTRRKPLPSPQGDAASRTGVGPDEKPAGKGSRLVRYPNAENALRALLKDSGHAAMTGEGRSAQGQVLSAVSRPLASKPSRPSVAAFRLVQDMGLNAGLVPPRPAPSDRPLPRIAPARILDGADLGDLVRIRRQMLKLSQKDLADRAGVGRRFVGELEAGKATAELGKALAICRALGLGLTVQVADGV